MALSIKDEETDALVRRLARLKKLSYTKAIRLAVANELERAGADDDGTAIRRRKAIADIQARVAALPELMSASQVDGWMYDENGLPH